MSAGGSCDTRGSDTQGSGFDKIQVNHKSIHHIVEKEKKHNNWPRCVDGTGGEVSVFK